MLRKCCQHSRTAANQTLTPPSRLIMCIHGSKNYQPEAGNQVCMSRPWLAKQNNAAVYQTQTLIVYWCISDGLQLLVLTYHWLAAVHFPKPGTSAPGLPAHALGCYGVSRFADHTRKLMQRVAAIPHVPTATIKQAHGSAGWLMSETEGGNHPKGQPPLVHQSIAWYGAS
jgi:hypothetical protein